MNSFTFMLCPYRRLYSFMFMACRGAILCARPSMPAPFAPAPSNGSPLLTHPAVGGDDNQRRGNSPPRRRWQLCVAGYFADQSVGDMPGVSSRPPELPPRRRWQAVLLHTTPHPRQSGNESVKCERQRAPPSAPSAPRSPTAPPPHCNRSASSAIGAHAP